MFPRYILYIMVDEPRIHLNAVQLEQALTLLGDLLAQRGQTFEVVVIGGANLAMRGLVVRTTVDVDVVAQRIETGSTYETAHPLPEPLRIAIEDVASILDLPRRWMNGAASSDFELGLPPGYEDRVHVVAYRALRVAFGDRQDIVAWKLQAAVDRWGTENRHLADLRRLQPTRSEIDAARRWFESMETPSSGFWQNLDAVLRELGHA